MYLFKNAWRNLTRNKGRNILIGIIITVITTCTCVALAIHKAGNNLVSTYTETNPLAVTFNLDMSKLRSASDTTKSSFQSLTVDDIKKYADSDLVKDYYYTLEASVNSTTASPVEDNSRPTTDSNSNDSNAPQNDNKNDMKASVGDFRITAYSNFAYLTDFTDGTKKITSGKMVTGSSTSDECVISKDLASANSLKVGDTITLDLTSDSSKTYTLTIIGIYKDSSSSTSSSFMQMNALNSANQIYANTSTVQNILDAEGTDSTKLVASNGLTAKFYLTSNSYLSKFTKEVKSKGLSSYYTVTTNKAEVESTLTPIKNISTFSMNFLIVIIIIGVVVLAVINFLNIRDRKYEIGVLRAIGMSKFKVTEQLVLEIFFVALISLAIGTTVGTIISQPVTNKMLASEIKSYSEQQSNTQNNFGGAGFGKPSEAMPSNSTSSSNNTSSSNKGNGNAPTMKSMSTTNYVKSLKVHVDALTILELFGISIILTVASGAVASLVVNKYSPNKILQDRV